MRPEQVSGWTWSQVGRARGAGEEARGKRPWPRGGEGGQKEGAVSAPTGDCPVATVDRNASGDLCWDQAGGGSRNSVAKTGPLVPEV